MMTRKILAGLTLVGLMSTAAPAVASSIIGARCDSLTDNDAQGCVFSGNIDNAPAGNVNSFLTAQDAYNAAFNPDIALNFLITLQGNGNDLTGTFDFSQQFAGFTIDFIAVKAAQEFILLQNIGGTLQGSFSSAGLFTPNGRNQPGISHVSFFGSRGTVPAVPEPTTWAFMLVGFGAIGYSMRRRNKGLYGKVQAV